jgi:hypothetical protein
VQPFVDAGDERYAVVATQNCPATLIECININVDYPAQQGTILVDTFTGSAGETSVSEKCLKNVDADSNSVLGIVLADPYADATTFFAAIDYTYSFTMYGEVEDNSITNGFTRRLIEAVDKVLHVPLFKYMENVPNHTKKDIFFSSSWISRCTAKPDPVRFEGYG